MFTALMQQQKAGRNQSLFAIFKIILLLSSLYFLPGCGSSDEVSAWGKFKPLNEIDEHIQQYYEASLGESVNPKKDNPAVYIDFSDGLSQAYTGNAENSTMIKAICDKLQDPSIEWYAMESSKISRLQENNFQISDRITSVKSYSKTMAPIEDALKQITDSENDALLVTDFEEYKQNEKGAYEEDTRSYPQNYFTKWLKNGNSITFFYGDAYPESNKGKNTLKHLYFAVFTHSKPTSTSLVTTIRQTLQGKSNPRFFELTNKPYEVFNNYGGKGNTGIANAAFSKWVNYNFNASSETKFPYEVIGTNKPWNDALDKYIRNIISKEDGLFLDKLFLNAADQSAYKLNKLAVKVYDVSNDYENFARCNEAKNHVPVLVKNSKKDLVWDDNSKKDPIIRECYEPDTKNLKETWLYKAGTSRLTPWPEIFDLDNDVFNGHLKNDPGNIELRTVFHPNYKQKNVKKENALIRIDYVIDDATFNDTNSQLTDFQWKSITKPENQNTSLSEAIRNTLQDPAVNPKGNIIYSYYIKFANTAKPGNN
jgi:hypothetical protein